MDFELLYSLIFSKQTLLCITLLSFLSKLFLLLACIRFSFKTLNHRMLLFFIIIFLTISLSNDVFNVMYLTKRALLGITENIPSFTFFGRIIWGLIITQYQSIALFIEYLLHKRIRFTFFHALHLLVNGAISSVFFYHAFFKYHVESADPETLQVALFLQNAVYIYLPFLFVPLFFKIFRHKNAQAPIPHVLVHQLRYLTAFFIPYILSETFGNSTFLIFLVPAIDPYKYTLDALFFTLSALLSSYPLFFISRRMLGLRFLNLRKDVESQEKFNFLSQFKDILEQLSYATALKELAHLNQTFFLAAFNIPLGRTRLFIRKTEPEKETHGYFDLANISAKVEHFIGKTNSSALAVLSSSKVFIRDEIEFSHFYEDDDTSKEIVEFMDSINADIFLPIFERNSIIAYTIIERNARPSALFTNKERDEMLVFTSYLSNIINILKYSNVDAMLHSKKELTEELYLKHQEINQYKECIRSFLRSNKERKIGIIFYKYRRFTFANEAAQELVGMDLNTNVGHSLTQACKSVALKVQEFKTPQTAFARDNQNKRIIISGIPSLEEHATILLIYFPEISDIIKAQFDQLKDPSSWDYVLYLETTQTGQLVNQLIPGSGEKVLNFKINLLSTALSKKATLIDMPEDDLLATVEILHHISLRQTLHTLMLAGPEKNDEVAITLFGLNPLLQKDAPEPLLSKLNDTGTLYIQNIEYLSLETQKYLAEFILYGYFHKFKSDHKIFSNVRIICSTNKDLLSLVNDGTFSKALYNELHKNALALPSLSSFLNPKLMNLHRDIRIRSSYKCLKICLHLLKKKA